MSRRYTSCRRKRQYMTEEAAEGAVVEAAQRGYDIGSPYPCTEFCGLWHVGHIYPGDRFAVPYSKDHDHERPAAAHPQHR